MQLHTWIVRFAAAAFLSLAVGVAPAKISAAQDPLAQDPLAPAPGADPEGVETLTRGPVHEAFAAPAASDPKPTPIVPNKPPADIDEVQPDFRPEGAIWINGYWEFDPEVKDFIWISGLWRVPPPAMRWVPPYWTEVEGGWQRVPGFWISTAAGELEYRPVPPNSLEVGPSSPAPADNYFYIPGAWNYYDTGYRWRSGYWSPYREDFVWCPARWVWTPAGCIYQAGYWDLRPLVRAQCYAPVRFTSAVYLTPGWRYRPWCVVDSSRFFVHLWIGPQSNCYYFGNYYGSYATTFGLTPWCSWSYRSRGCYDPLWSWCHTHYRRQGIDYIGRCRGWHDHFDHHEHERPARTWNEQVRLIADAKLDPRKSQRVVAADLADVVKRNDSPIRLTRLDDRERESIVKVSSDLKKLNVERLKIEREARTSRGSVSLDNTRHEDDDNKPDDDKPNVVRTGRTPRIDLPKSTVELPGAALPSGDDKTAADATPNDKPDGGKPDAGKVASRVDELTKELAKKSGEGKKTARLRLPEQTDAIREITKNSRTTTRSRDDAPGGGLKETTINLPKRTEGRPRINLGSESGAGSTAGGSTASTVPSAGPDLKPPSVDGSGGNKQGGSNQGDSSSRSRRSASGPKIELPQASSAGSDAPQVESRGRQSRAAQPRIELPKIESSPGSAPKSAAPKIEAPKIDSRSNRSGENSIRSGQPRINLPTSSSGGSSGPKFEARSNRSGGGSTRIETPKISAPKIESAPRSSPRMEIPRSSQSHSMQSSSRSRSEGARSTSGGNSGGGNSGNSSRSRGRNRDD